MGQNQYWTANYRSDCLLIITLHHVNSILICLAFYSNRDMIIKLTFIKSTTFSPFLNVIFFRFPIINLFTVEVSSNCNTLKNKKKVPPISKVPHSKTWHYQNGNKAVKCIHMCAWGTADLVKLNCMPFHPAVNYSITTHTCLSISKLPSLHYRQPWSPSYLRYTGILAYSSHLQVLISQHLAHVSSGDNEIYCTCDFQGDFRWGVLEH